MRTFAAKSELLGDVGIRPNHIDAFDFIGSGAVGKAIEDVCGPKSIAAEWSDLDAIKAVGRGVVGNTPLVAVIGAVSGRANNERREKEIWIRRQR